MRLSNPRCVMRFADPSRKQVDVLLDRGGLIFKDDVMPVRSLPGIKLVLLWGGLKHTSSKQRLGDGCGVPCKTS